MNVASPAFWERPDWSGGDSLRSGAPGFRMLEMAPEPVQRYGSVYDYMEDEKVDYIWPKWGVHGVCPRCSRAVRQIEIDGSKLYTCSESECTMSKQAWGNDSGGYVLQRHPLGWIRR